MAMEPGRPERRVLAAQRRSGQRLRPDQRHRFALQPGDPGEHYVPRMDWAAGSDEVLLQRFNRRQNTDEVMLGDVRTGRVRTVLTERDSTWVEVVNDVVWLNGGKSFTWVSERDGWKHVYVVSRDGKSTRPLTRGPFDVLGIS